MTEDAGFDLGASPGHLLHRAQQFAAERFVEATGGVEITQRQFAVMSAVAAEEGLTQTQLVKATGIDRSTLAELVARMAGKGLLLRERAAHDARANAVRFTEAGRALFETVRAGAMAADEAILSALPKSKRAAFVEGLTRIAATIDQDEEAIKLEKLKEKEAKAKEKAKEKIKAEKPKKSKDKTKKKKKKKSA
jgi:DNA-binding MarR family transcriptional regulator